MSDWAVEFVTYCDWLGLIIDCRWCHLIGGTILTPT